MILKRTIILFYLAFLSQTSFSQIFDVYKVTKEENKYVYQDKYLKLFMDDEIFLQAISVNDTLKQFIVVKKVTDKSNTISISFKMEDFGGTKSSILRTKNPFNKQLSFKAKISTLKNPFFEETSIIPIFPNIFSIEQWPYRIESIILYDFMLQ